MSKPVVYSPKRDISQGILYEIIYSANPAGPQRKEDKRLSKDPPQACPEQPNLAEATQPQSFFVLFSFVVVEKTARLE